VSWFKRKPSLREKRIADVVEAWETFPKRDKPEMMIKHPDLYWSVAWLASHEVVAKRIKRRGL
jgi:hypothetical protein